MVQRIIRTGMDLKVAHSTTYGRIKFNRGRKLHVLEVAEDGLCLVAFHTPLLNLHGRPDPELTVVDHETGFKHTLWLPLSFLRDNFNKV